MLLKNSPKLQVFGEVAEGLDTLTRINEAYADEKGRPYKNIRYLFEKRKTFHYCLRNIKGIAKRPKEEVDNQKLLPLAYIPLKDQNFRRNLKVYTLLEIKI